jgi:murein DD-endopeptidase MepM/ murein hydrolase activator NlpD
VKRRSLLVLVALTAAAAVATPVRALDLEDDLEQVESRVAEVSAQMSTASENRSDLAVDIVDTEARLNDLLVEVGRIRLQLATVQAQLVEQQDLLATARAQLEVLHAELARTQDELDSGREQAVEWARQLYMGSGQDETYLALSAAHLSEINIGLEYLDRIATENSRAIVVYEALRRLEEQQADRVRAREAALTAEIAELGRLENELGDLNAKLADQQAAVESELANQRSNLAELEASIEMFEGELASLEAEQARIEAAIAAEQAAGDTADAGGGDTSTGAFVRPVPGRITSGFGPRTHPILGYVRTHTGVDFTAPYGQEIRAAAGGRVILAGWFGGYGNTVVVDHGGGMATLYAHQSKLAVGYGAGVVAGDVIGYVGSTGLSTGPHLHFEVRINGSPVDPVPYL